MNIDVYEKEDQLWTTSRNVAEVFGKEHKHVLDKIKGLECSEDFNRSNFRLVEYTDAKGEKRPMYEMTQDGWAFLVMGFTGKQAAQFKEKYIAAFNKMRGAIEKISNTQSDLLALALQNQKQLISLAKNNSGEIQNIKKTVDDVVGKVDTISVKVLQLDDWMRKAFPAKTVKIWLAVIKKYFDWKCPCCQQVNIRAIHQKDHWYGAKWNNITQGWPICEDCHNKLTHGPIARSGWAEDAFKNFQIRIEQYLKQGQNKNQMSLF